MANDTNAVVLVGRLTRDAELKYTNSGMAVCRFTIANNKRKNSGDGWTDVARFFDIVIWGKQGETLIQYLKKGKQVAIQGELEQDRWEQEGKSRSKVEINAISVQLLGGIDRQDGVSGGSPMPYSVKAPWHGSAGGGRPVPDVPVDMEQQFTDDIPF